MLNDFHGSSIDFHGFPFIDVHGFADFLSTNFHKFPLFSLHFMGLATFWL